MAKEIIISNNPQTTLELGERTAKTLHEGDIIALQGELGAGKTTFIQGLAHGLGIHDRIISPTFVYVHQHKIPQGKGVFNHIDLYRVKDFEDLESIHFFDLLGESTITAIEWPELIIDKLPREPILIRFAYGDSPNLRVITIERADIVH